MPSTASVTEAKREFSELLNRVAYGQERVIVTSYDRPKAAIISLDDLERLELIEAALEADAEFEAGKALEFEKVKDRL
jgi:prevent-host-death family protein